MAEVDITKLIFEAGLEIEGNKINLPSWCKRVKLDCGLAFNAPQTAQWLADDDDLIVIGFEPVSSNVKILKSGIREDPKIKYVETKDINTRFFIVEAALGEFTKRQNIHVTKIDPGCSSLLNPIDFEVERIEAVSVIKLNDFLKYFPFERVEYIEHLKTDCQGTDFDALLGAREYLDRIAAVTCEVESLSYANSRNTFDNVAKLLNDCGFIPVNNSPQIITNVSKNFRESVLKKYLRLIYKKTIRKRYAKISSNLEDPTFVNRKYQNKILSGEIKLHQKG